MFCLQSFLLCTNILTTSSVIRSYWCRWSCQKNQQDLQHNLWIMPVALVITYQTWVCECGSRSIVDWHQMTLEFFKVWTQFYFSLCGCCGDWMIFYLIRNGSIFLCEMFHSTPPPMKTCDGAAAAARSKMRK